MLHIQNSKQKNQSIEAFKSSEVKLRDNRLYSNNNNWEDENSSSKSIKFKQIVQKENNKSTEIKTKSEREFDIYSNNN